VKDAPTPASPSAAVPELSHALRSIREAARVLAPLIRRTPIVYSHTLSETAGGDVYLKLENLQRTGSFKIRGAARKILSLDPEIRAKGGLVAASAGNHAQGVALAARQCGCRATIVMPLRTPIVKVQRTREYGALVILHGENYDGAHEHAAALARERGATLVHPFDDAAIIEGQGTVGLEIVEDVPEIDTIVVPVGGGGLVSGIALAAKALKPAIRVVGVQAAGAAPMAESVRSGRVVRVADPRTIADGIRVGAPGYLTLAIVRRYVDEIVTVEDDEITEAVVQAMEKQKIVAEPAGVAAMAAVMTGRVAVAGRKVCAVVTGGNVDMNLVARLVESGLARAGRTHLVRVRMRDEPGQLRRVLETVAEHDVNVLDVQHYRAGWRVPVGFVDVELLSETRYASQGAEVDAALRSRGFEIR
jgi:threonine dehydratase